MGQGYKIEKIDKLDGRTLMSLSNTSRITEIKKLEQDISVKDLSNESKRSIERGIQDVVSDILTKDIGNCCPGNSYGLKYAFYRDQEKGVDAYFEDCVLIDESKGPFNPCIKPSLNIQIEDSNNLSLQLTFDVNAPYPVIRDILYMHSTLTGEYYLSEKPKGGGVHPDLVVNPADKGGFFLEAAKRMYQELEKIDGVHSKLLGLRRESHLNEDVNQKFKEIYAFELISFLGADLYFDN